VIAAIINSALAGLNVWAYLAWDDPANLAVAVFCGLLAIVCAVWSS
jgi:hypothetical protein